MKIATFSLLLLITSAKCRNLTESENQMRLRNCGRQMLGTPQFPNNYIDPVSIDYPQNGLIVTVMVNSSRPTKNDDLQAQRALGTFISPRHILTSSQPIMNDKKQWIWEEEVEKRAFRKKYLRVPKSPIKHKSVNYKLVVGIQRSDLSCMDLEVEEAWIYIEHQPDISLMRNPMIITLKTDHPNINFPCLAENSTALNVTQMMHIYGLNKNNQSALDYRFLPITEFANDERWIHTEKYGFESDKGGPMIAEIDGKVTIAGMTADAPAGYHYDLRVLTNQICYLSGVCDVDLIPIPSTAPLPIPDNKKRNRTKRPMMMMMDEEEYDDGVYLEGVEYENDEKMDANGRKSGRKLNLNFFWYFSGFLTFFNFIFKNFEVL